MTVERGGTNRLLDILERVAEGGVQIAEAGCVPLPPAADGENSESQVPASSADIPDRTNEPEP
jgi:hypothetical protein